MLCSQRACSAGKVEAVKALLADQRVNLEDRDGEGSSPLLVAVAAGQAPVALYLASVGADLEVLHLPQPSVRMWTCSVNELCLCES